LQENGAQICIKKEERTENESESTKRQLQDLVKLFLHTTQIQLSNE